MFKRDRSDLWAAIAAAALAAAEPTLAQAPPVPTPDPKAVLAQPRKPASVKDGFDLTVVGDLLLPRPISRSGDAKLAEVVRLLQADDLTIGNQEGVFVDKETFKGSGYGSGLLIGEAGVAADQKAMGIEMVGLANNHATDWGRDGLTAMTTLLDRAGVPHAGAGATRKAAYSASFIQTPKGKVGLVASTSTFKVNAGALDAGEDTPPRAGISILRTRAIRQISQAAMDDLRAFQAKSGPVRGGRADQIAIGGQTFRVTDRADATAFTFEMNLYDHLAILQSIREAKQQSDMVVFTIHAHESPTGEDGGGGLTPADFLPELFHNAIDAGADVAAATGSHTMRGVEIYKGKPVFYGLAAFIFRGDRRWMPDSLQANAYPGAAPGSYGVPASYLAKDFKATDFDGIVATATFDGDQLREVRIYPLDLGQSEDWARRGVPHLADAANARRILETLQRDSKVFGTRIDIEGAVGVIRPTGASS